MKAQCCMSKDIISNLPQSIIETILCLLPIQDAVRTSILSKKWRYNWVKIPKLVFNYKDMFKKPSDGNQLSILEQTFDEPPSARKHLTKRCKVFYAIYQVLMLHEGPIHEFTLSMNANDTCVEIDQIIHHLSKNNTLKKLTLQLKYIFRCRIPVSVFSLHQLTDLHLAECDLVHRQKFNVSGSLRSLYLDDVNTNAKTLVHLISKSPLLKTLTVITSDFSVNSHGLILPNYFSNYGGSTLTELFKCLPLLEHLCVSVWIIKCFAEDMVPRELPTSLVHLKYLFLDNMCLIHKHGLPILVLLIRTSPNLQKIKLQLSLTDSSESEINSVTLDDYSDIWLEHLNELEIVHLGNVKPELEFVKLMLAKSPVLKKVRISLDDVVTKDEELEMLRIFLQYPKASSLVKIYVIHHV